MYYPSLDELKKLKGQGHMVPVYREIVADLDTPVSAFLKISRGGHSFLLESVEGGQSLARYSFIGTEPYKEIITRSEDKLSPLSLISDEISKFKVIPVEGLPRFCGGAVGYLGYETAMRFEELPSPTDNPLGLPESQFMLVDTMLIFDHFTHTIKVMSYTRLDGEIEKDYEEAINKINTLVKRLNQPLQYIPEKNSIPFRENYNLSSNYTRAEFEASVTKIKQYITAGEAIQVVLSQRLRRPTDASPFEIYRALRTINPSPYMFYLDFNDFQIVGASPEILVRVEDGDIMTRPLAGTRPRGKTVADDERLEKELRSDEKEQAEHIMLVDLGRNDIGRVSQPGSIVVSQLMDVEKYSHVMHLVTNIQGKLREDLTAFHALQSCFPAGTVSGAPKIRAMEIIAELEPDKRGVYAGAAGYFSFSGNMDMAISIRTLVLKKGVAYIQAGCGIVYDSVPEREFEETMNKARAMIKAVEQAESFSLSAGGKYVVID